MIPIEICNQIKNGVQIWNPTYPGLNIDFGWKIPFLNIDEYFKNKEFLFICAFKNFHKIKYFLLKVKFLPFFSLEIIFPEYKKNKKKSVWKSLSTDLLGYFVVAIAGSIKRFSLYSASFILKIKNQFLLISKSTQKLNDFT